MKSTSRVRHKCAISPACARRNESSIDLLGYWMARAPPGNAASTLPTSAIESASSGVTAYKPLTGLFILPPFLACPEQATRHQLSHARPISVLERLPGIFLCIAYCFRNGKAVGDRRRNGRRQRTPGPVISARQPLPGIRSHHALLFVEHVDYLGRILMRAGDEHVFASQSQYPARAFRQVRVVLIVRIVVLSQPAHFEAVGRD